MTVQQLIDELNNAIITGECFPDDTIVISVSGEKVAYDYMLFDEVKVDYGRTPSDAVCIESNNCIGM